MLPILAPLLLWSTPPAPLECLPAVAELGTARTGPPLTQTFRLTHRGEVGTVRITAVETGCGCVGRELSRSTLAPGESAELTLTINTLTQPAGPNSWRATIRYRHDLPGRHGGERVLELAVRAELIREVSVDPPELAFSTAGTAQQAITVTDRRPRPLTVLGATTSSAHLAAEPRPYTDAAGVRSQPVIVRVSADAPAGESAEIVSLTTDDPSCPVLRIPVRLAKRPVQSVTVSPPELRFSFANGQHELSGNVLLRAGGRPIRIASATADSPAVTASHASSGPVATLRVRVKTEAGAFSGHANVTVTLSEPPGEKVIVPVGWENR